jgi:DNA-binding transcriptional regulator YhcF (GntR family)
VNVFNLLNNFFREDAREKVSSSATKLYFFLIYEANKSYWEGPLMLSVRRLSSLLSFSKNTVSKSLSELEDRGLIICYPQKGNSLTAKKENSLAADKDDGLTAKKDDSLTVNKRDSLTASRKDSLAAANNEGGLSVHKEDSLTTNVEGKGVSSSAFWFSDLELSETASRQTRMTASWQTRGTASQEMRKEKKEVCDKGESKYAKFF